MLRPLYLNLEEYLCTAFCAVMIGCLMVQVGIRMISGSALAWTEELSRYCFIWTVYLGMSLATKRLSQVRITAQFLKAPPRVRLAFRMAGDLLCLAFNAVIVWQCWDVIREGYAFPEMSPTLGIVKAHVELIIPISFSLTSWRMVELYIVNWRAGTLDALVRNVGEAG